MTMKDLHAIQLDDVRLKLGSQDFAFDCAFERGVVTAVIGASGSGKSTLLNLIAGFERPDEGRIVIEAQDMTAFDPAERPVSLIFQENNLFAHLDIFTNVALGVSPSLKMSVDELARVSDALVRVGLGGFEKRLPATLSGGERQRAALARTLVRNRPVMLLDEPFAALDPGLRSGMAGLLSELQAENASTVLLVTHQPDEVKRLAKRVIFLDQGRILFDGPVYDFLAGNAGPEIDRFLKG